MAKNTRDDSVACSYFKDERFELFAWVECNGDLRAFQLAYLDNDGREQVTSWQTDDGFRYYVVDDGESVPVRNDSPILLPTARPLNLTEIAEAFSSRASASENPLMKIIAKHLRGAVGDRGV